MIDDSAADNCADLRTLSTPNLRKSPLHPSSTNCSATGNPHVFRYLLDCGTHRSNVYRLTWSTDYCLQPGLSVEQWTSRWASTRLMCVLVRLLRPSFTSHKFRLHRRPSHHISLGKSPTSSSHSFQMSTAIYFVLATVHCAVAPLSVATGCQPAATLSSPMSP